MQGSDLNSPVIPQRLLAAEQQQISPGIEQLILKAESENAEAVKLIETDKQRYSALLRQLDEKTRQVEGLEKSTSQLDEEAKQLYQQFTQNREICESLKRTNSVLQEHEEALLKKKEMVLVKAQQSRLENQGVLAKYQAIWDRYKKQYDRRENAKELERVKSSTMKDEEELERIKCAVLNMQTGISSMETDKKNMEETIERGFRSAIPVILKLAQLNLETRATADSIQEVTTKVMQTTKELATISEEKKQQNKSPNKGAPMMELPQAPLQSPVRPSLHLASPLVHNIASTPKPMQTKRDDHSHVEEESSEDRSMDKQHDETPPTRGLFHAQNEHVPLITASQQFSTSDTQAVQTTSVAKDKHCTEAQIQTSQSDIRQIGCSVANSTAINENHTEEEPVFPATPISTGLQSNTGFTPSSEASNSPFNFEMHSNIIQQLTKSPGDGFLFQSRPMFDSSVEREKELAKTENTNFIFNIEEARNLAPTGSGSEFQMSQQNSNFFGSPVSEESEGGAGFFGTSLPTFSGCSIFGEASPNQTKQQQKTTAFHEFSFSFGNNSPSTTDNTPDSLAAFSLF